MADGPLFRGVSVVDCHAHLGRFEGYDLSPETLLSELEGAGVDLALVSNIDGASVPGKTANLSQEEANARTAELVRAHPGRLRGLLWARPDREDPGGLERFLGETVVSRRWTRRLFVGVKLHPEMNQCPADDPRVDPFLELAKEAGLPVVVHSDGRVDEASPERIAALGRRHPDVGVVLYHMAFHGPHERAIRVVERSVVDGEGRLYLETSQADPGAVVEAVRRVGARRVLFGSDAPYYGKGHYGRYRPQIDALGGAVDADGRRRILYQNSLELFGLEPEPPERETR